MPALIYRLLIFILNNNNTNNATAACCMKAEDAGGRPQICSCRKIIILTVKSSYLTIGTNLVIVRAAGRKVIIMN